MWTAAFNESYSEMNSILFSVKATRKCNTSANRQFWGRHVLLDQVEKSQPIAVHSKCKLLLLFLVSQDGNANYFHSSKGLDNWGFVLGLTPDESWLLTKGEAWQIVIRIMSLFTTQNRSALTLRVQLNMSSPMYILAKTSFRNAYL